MKASLFVASSLGLLATLSSTVLGFAVRVERDGKLESPSQHLIANMSAAAIIEGRDSSDYGYQAYGVTTTVVEGFPVTTECSGGTAATVSPTCTGNVLSPRQLASSNSSDEGVEAILTTSTALSVSTFEGLSTSTVLSTSSLLLSSS